ncbi:MAG: hypothetical protein M3Z66_11715 [Chloroflexota bacterium]|nr:hypothetical protein [Chloroflexota bacterium]
MQLLGFFFLIVGFVMNIQIMRRSRQAKLTAGQIVAMMPWLISAALIAIGALLLVVGAR